MAPLTYLVAGATVLCSAAIGANAANASVQMQAVPFAVEAFNKARAARLDVREDQVKAHTSSDTPNSADGDIDSAVKALFNSGAATACVLSGAFTPENSGVKGFFFSAPSGSDVTKDAFETFIQKQIDDGLAAIGTHDTQNFDKTGVYADANPAAQNFGYMFDKLAKTVACRMTQGCTSGNSIVLCRFYPAILSNAPPFTPDFYAAVKARKDKGLLIKDIPATDIGKGLTSGAGGGGSSSAHAIVPATIFISMLGLINM